MICVDVDGDTIVNDPLTYGDIVLSESAKQYLSPENGTLRAIKTGAVAIGIKALSGTTKYYRIEVGCAHINKITEAAVPATCSTTGNIEYYTCVDCGVFLKMEDDKYIEIEENGWIIPVNHVHHFEVDVCRDCGIGYDIAGLDVLSIPAAITVVEEEAFAGIAAQVIIVPSTCSAIEDHAFANCGNLRFVFIPRALEETVPENAFEGCVDPEIIYK